jgi:hypothetical protein
VSDDLTELEKRVGEKWAAASAARMDPQWNFLDTSSCPGKTGPMIVTVGAETNT